MNLNGTLSATSVNVVANNINSNNGTSGDSWYRTRARSIFNSSAT